ncbi:hypothetical protein GXW78_17000 [Roseomonas terrae]|uniref:Uncharacterized protein n=1 Tax=Neoroseomonas terrae TaxID=424799 RepID=A0ABS5EK33_9PROT|nr:hypothetical protein [Neoroseomonas terrae]MBR0651374.1 hypothetical protein [Neoroseomonas terrae]
MSWDEIEQAASKPTTGPASLCSVSLKAARGGMQKLVVTLAAEVLAELGWASDQSVTLAVGRGDEAGFVQLRVREMGVRLRPIGRSTYRTVALRVPDDMARWEAPKKAASHQVVRVRGEVCCLLITLPWDLSGDPEGADEDEATAEEEAAAA